MAILKSKQLSTQLTGSYILSGSTQTFIGNTQLSGSVEASGSLTLRGASVDLNLRSDDNTTIAKLLTTSAGNSQLILYDNDNFSAQSTIDLNSSSTTIIPSLTQLSAIPAAPTPVVAIPVPIPVTQRVKHNKIKKKEIVDSFVVGGYSEK